MKLNDLTGKRFGRLIVLNRSDVVTKDGRRRTAWNCKCDCGNTKVVLADNLKMNKTTSCGCFQKERASDALIKHGDTDSRLYNVWSAMKRRCFNKDVPEYSLYGGRGITMCDEWRDDYSSFKKWAVDNGYDYNAPRGKCTIDRIDVNGNYSPDNCRWVDQKTQMNNVTYNHIVEYKGKTYTVKELSDETGISYDKLLQRINRYGYTVEDAVEKD